MSDGSEVDIDDASSFEDKSFGDDASDDDDVVTVVDKKKAVAKGKPASSGSASGALALNKNADNVQKASAKGKKTVEETYQKKTMREHILLRPDTYSTFHRSAVRRWCHVFISSFFRSLFLS